MSPQTVWVTTGQGLYSVPVASASFEVAGVRVGLSALQPGVPVVATAPVLSPVQYVPAQYVQPRYYYAPQYVQPVAVPIYVQPGAVYVKPQPVYGAPGCGRKNGHHKHGH